MNLIGDIRQKGEWDLKKFEYWLSFGDVNLDLRMAHINVDETLVRVFMIIGDVEISLPDDVELWFESNGIVSSATINGWEKEQFMQTV